jgi:CheY-like chemotaxis protein
MTMSTDLILVIDDDEDLGAVLVELLEGQGYKCRVAVNGAEAFAALAEVRPVLVLLDWYIPGGDPAAVGRLCHERGIPLVLSTASARPDERAESIGASATLNKPFDIDGFFAVIERLLGRPSADDGRTPSYS